ncbi:hypothetical protein HMPREF1141_1914 [Clostridium sp. MSTE9]|nr:hypothetical protein HMPREF1141_1914 [Clostridium sp. MSTE9]
MDKRGICRDEKITDIALFHFSSQFCCEWLHSGRISGFVCGSEQRA